MANQQPRELSQPWKDWIASRKEATLTTEPDGSICIHVETELTSVGRELADAPGSYTEEHTFDDWMEDDAGNEVEIECTDGVLSCPEERAVVTYADHWQAGLSMQVTLYPDDSSYRVGIRDALPTPEQHELPERERQFMDMLNNLLEQLENPDEEAALRGLQELGCIPDEHGGHHVIEAVATGELPSSERAMNLARRLLAEWKTRPGSARG